MRAAAPIEPQSELVGSRLLGFQLGRQRQRSCGGLAAADSGLEIPYMAGLRELLTIARESAADSVICAGRRYSAGGDFGLSPG
jgi:hypothetical protein